MALDRFGREINYLRISLTDRCNLRCVYCMPAEGIEFAAPGSLLTASEILRIVGIAAALGVTKIRYTGGEPLARAEIVDLVAGAAATAGVESVHLTTNGIHLARRARELRDAGLGGGVANPGTEAQPNRHAGRARGEGAASLRGEGAERRAQCGDCAH